MLGLCAGGNPWPTPDLVSTVGSTYRRRTTLLVRRWQAGFLPAMRLPTAPVIVSTEALLARHAGSKASGYRPFPSGRLLQSSR
jgi:hypothetical protein